jgi:DNA-binding protein
MEAYRRVQRTEESLPANEIRVRRGVGIGRYLKRAWELLNGTNDSNDTIIIKGVSNAVQSAVSLAELIKHRVKGLHQINKISNITIVDQYDPLYEGLDKLEFSRIVTMLQITLTKSSNVDKTDIGYQEPIPESEVQEYDERERLDGDRR